MCLKSVFVLDLLSTYGLLVDLSVKSIGRVSFNLDRLILEYLIFVFYIMHITFLFTFHVKFSTKI